jgi:hypothetical protein
MSESEGRGAEPSWPPINPWHLMGLAAGLSLLALLVSAMPADFPRVLFILPALMAAGAAITLRPKSPELVLAGSILALLLALMLDPEWDSAQGVVVLLGVIGLFAASLLGLPLLAAAATIWFAPERDRGHRRDPSPELLPQAEGISLLCGVASALVLLVLFFALVPRTGGYPGWKVQLGMVIAFAGVVLLVPVVLGFILPRTAAAAGRPRGDLADWGRHLGRQVSRGVISILTIFHFCGILSAFMSAPPPNRPASWLAQQVWAFAQPYLQFVYLVNAYRFYSPEPGPPSLVWFYIHYSDGTIREVRVPDRKTESYDPLDQQYYRRLSLGQNLNQIMQTPVSPVLKEAREAAGNPDLNSDLKGPIPLHPNMTLEAQYRPPLDHCRKLVEEYARFIAHRYQSENPNVKVTGVKVYHVLHTMLDPQEMVDRKLHPTDGWTYLAYYQGEFTPEGNLKDPTDPFLYWLIPHYRQVQPVFDPRYPESPIMIREVTVNGMAEHVRLKTKSGENSR